MMIHQPASLWPGRQHGPFKIRRMRPGHGLGVAGDDGLGPLGTIDRASLSGGLTVPMHEHRDDEILSYLRQGELHHTDNVAPPETLTPSHLMLMNSGSGLSHEEHIPRSAPTTTEMLQIFVRPHTASLPPRLQFHSFAATTSPAKDWRLIAGPEGASAPLELRNQVWVHDRHCRAEDLITLTPAPGLAIWLHLFSGTASLPSGSDLTEGDSVLWVDETPPALQIHHPAELIVFLVDLTAPFTRLGSLSG
jgi:quercetin 2,3-dioxygenase